MLRHRDRRDVVCLARIHTKTRLELTVVRLTCVATAVVSVFFEALFEEMPDQLDKDADHRKQLRVRWLTPPVGHAQLDSRVV